jgi:hypothetical protein
MLANHFVGHYVLLLWCSTAGELESGRWPAGCRPDFFLFGKDQLHQPFVLPSCSQKRYDTMSWFPAGEYVPGRWPASCRVLQGLPLK